MLKRIGISRYLQARECKAAKGSSAPAATVVEGTNPRLANVVEIKFNRKEIV